MHRNWTFSLLCEIIEIVDERESTVPAKDFAFLPLSLNPICTLSMSPLLESPPRFGNDATGKIMIEKLYATRTMPITVSHARTSLLYCCNHPASTKQEFLFEHSLFTKLSMKEENE